MVSCQSLGHYHISGNERMISLSHLGEHAHSGDLILTPQLLCTNRDLPNKLPMGLHQPIFEFQHGDQEAVDMMYCIKPISLAHHRKIAEQDDVDLINHLHLNAINFADGENTLTTLKEVLSLYHYDDRHDSKLIQDAGPPH